MQDLSYNDLGRVIANNRSGNAGDIRYAYDDLHGWVTGINTGAGFEQRMYRETNGADNYLLSRKTQSIVKYDSRNPIIGKRRSIRKKNNYNF